MSKTWKAAKRTNSFLCYISEFDEAGDFTRSIADCSDMETANLIAAAPDILAALENLIERLELDALIMPGHKELAECLNQAEAAIAKARGEA